MLKMNRASRNEIYALKKERTPLYSGRGWAKSLKNRRKHYKILKQDFIVLFSLIN